MYLEHFGLAEYPFTLTPNTEFFFDQGDHREALNVLLVALAGGEGFIKITGEVGTGKTLLCRQLLKSLGQDYVTAYIPNAFLAPNALRLALADELGLSAPRNIGQHRLLQRLSERLIELARAGRRVVLIIDEAQAMPHESLEAIRLLTNLETERYKLLQVVLFGQPELDARLARPSLRQLRQRVAFSHVLQPLRGAVLSAYLDYRLRAAGYSGAPMFSRPALWALHRGSRGIPRLINVLAHKSLLAAYGEGRDRVGRRHVLRAIVDTEDARDGRPVPAWAVPALLLCSVLGSAAVWSAWP